MDHPHQTRRFALSNESIKRGLTLATGILIALGSGSNYVYSGYAPQLASRLRISSTQVNLIGMAGNLGVYGSGPLWGKLIDSRGPRIPLLCAFFLQFIGYNGIRMFYQGSLRMLPSGSVVNEAEAVKGTAVGISGLGIVMMMCFMCMTGCGACAGLNSSMRATAAGLVLAGYGLSAFLFSNIARTFFPGDTNAFLLTLAIGTCLPMLVGMLCLKVVKVEGGGAEVGESGWGRVESGREGYERVGSGEEGESVVDEFVDEEDEDDEDDASKSLGIRSTPITPIKGQIKGNGQMNGPAVNIHPATPTTSTLLTTEASRDSIEVHRTSTDHRRHSSPSHSRTSSRRESHELSVSPPRPILLPDTPQDKDAQLTFGTHHRDHIQHPGNEGSMVRSHSVASHKTTKSLGVHEVDIYGAALFRKVDFWMSFMILALLSGTGLMYINNVGSVVLALASEGLTPKYDSVTIALYQASQVSTVSLWNCLGRVAMGMMTDYAKAKFRIRRIWFCSFISIIFAISQVSAQYVDSVEHLWRVSCLVGFAYGNLFALLPIVTLEIFGLAHFSSNWGIVSLSPGVGGNLANLMFGRVYDAHTIRASGLAGSARAFADKAIRLIARGGGAFIDPSDRSHDCIVGQQCYATAFKFTTTACIIALVLSLTAAIRRERQARKRKLAARLEAQWAQEGI